MREPGKLHWLAVLMVAAVFLSLSGCGENKLNTANYDRITNDMSEDEVVRILGKGEEQGEVDPSRLGVNMPDLGGGVGRGMKVMTWQDGSKKIIITFRGDKVVSKVANGL